LACFRRNAFLGVFGRWRPATSEGLSTTNSLAVRVYSPWIEQVGCHIPLSDQSRTRVWGEQVAVNAQGLASWIALTINLSVGCSLGGRGSGAGGKSGLVE